MRDTDYLLKKLIREMLDTRFEADESVVNEYVVKIREIQKEDTFEDYLQQVHASQYTGTDDDMPDDFERWLEQFDANDILEMVKEYER
jgi:predicted Zn-dependent peptidase